MSKWIDADAIKAFVENRYDITWETDTYEGGVKDACTDILEAIDTEPTLDLIRCRECRHAYLTSDKYCKFCDMWIDDDGNLIELYVSEYFYCAYGERSSE